MLNRLRIKRVFARTEAKNYFKPDFNRDIFLVSYPRSGNTWLRSIFFHAVTGSPPKSLSEIDYVIPDAHFPVLKKKLLQQHQYIVKSHERFQPNKLICKHIRIIYVVRDPRNVAVSYHRYLQNLKGEIIPIKDFLDDFFSGRIWPGRWDEHVRHWINISDKTNVCMVIVRYEDLVKRDMNSFLKMFQVLGSEYLSIDIHKLLNSHSIDDMRKRERAGNRPRIDRNRKYFIGNGIAEPVTEPEVQSRFEEFARSSVDVLERFSYVRG